MFAGERGRDQQQAGTGWLADFAAAVRRGEELAADVGGAERGRSQMTAESCFI